MIDNNAQRIRKIEAEFMDRIQMNEQREKAKFDSLFTMMRQNEQQADPSSSAPKTTFRVRKLS